VVHPRESSRDPCGSGPDWPEEEPVQDMHLLYQAPDRDAKVLGNHLAAVLNSGRVKDRTKRDSNRVREPRGRIRELGQETAQAARSCRSPHSLMLAGQTEPGAYQSREQEQQDHHHVTRRHGNDDGIARAASMQHDQARPRKHAPAHLRTQIMKVRDEFWR